MKTSALTLGALPFLSATSKFVSLENIDSVQLLENQHIRHGYYGNEYLQNELASSKLKSVRIDRFLNPEGDMTLVEMTGPFGNLRIFFNEKEVLIQRESDIKQLNSLTSGEVRWIIENKLAIGRIEAGDKIIKDFSECVILKNQGEACVYSKSFEMIQVSGSNELVVLIA